MIKHLNPNVIPCCVYFRLRKALAKFSHNPIFHYACSSLLTGNNGEKTVQPLWHYVCFFCFCFSGDETEDYIH